MDDSVIGGQTTLIEEGRARLAHRTSVIVGGMLPFLDSLVEPVVCADTEWRIIYRNPVFAASWRLTRGATPLVRRVEGNTVAMELSDHSGATSIVSLDFTEITDGHGHPQVYLAKARCDEDVVGELRQAAAIITARVAALDDLGPMRVWDDELDEQVGRLSSREREIFDLILEGNRVSTVANTLFLSENTVRNYLKRIYQKVGVHSLGELRERMASKAFHPAS